MFGRDGKGLLPAAAVQAKQEEVGQMDDRKKKAMKSYADHCRHAQCQEFLVGDKVIRRETRKESNSQYMTLSALQCLQQKEV